MTIDFGQTCIKTIEVENPQTVFLHPSTLIGIDGKINATRYASHDMIEFNHKELRIGVVLSIKRNQPAFAVLWSDETKSVAEEGFAVQETNRPDNPLSMTYV